MARRSVSVFNLSFLDIMSCGFGAVILVFMIISAQVSVRADKEHVELLGATNRLEEEILNGRKNMVRLLTQVDQRKQRMSNLQEEAKRLQAEIEELKDQLGELDDVSLAARMSVEQLESDIERLEEAKKRLLSEMEAQADSSGGRVRTYVGDGNRQYLTGMKMDGKRILILVDASASMLGRTYTNAIIYRNLSDDQKLRTPKWRSAIDAVDWITTRIPKTSEFQLMAFNTMPWSVVDGSNGKWTKVTDGDKLSAAINRLRTTVPQSGTSLYNVFDAIHNMDRKPDNIYLLTDGLPTQGKNRPANEKKIMPDSRLKFFRQAADRLPGGIPVNILLYPMDGDPDAAGYFWRLAIDTRGSFMTPSRDWP
ncbi:MAG: VWA domain-containing protein [Gammaproteobacteria bacterium]|nr:VWA domain-containing protein [Gammaproteobacteria bacterium]MCP4090060.1 VWA domain-containing protein [Gammaproteobacteria bacterium]MCP4277050.1 VWA domain-containing protein [Gammaproteobacteria bacterium]MCP4832727.1 VWA domain-containing protein [Gammaproteobacteria bacterium]MCP4929920.1 VWA domain-containing protein [Gammaproteobacteria bacterium]